MKIYILFGILLAMLIGAGLGVNESKGTPDIRNNATKYTIAANLKANNTPAWSNNDEDFSFANQGFIATDDPLIIPSDYPNYTSWNMEAFSFLDNGTCPDTINPLLYRHARLNNINGLFEVVPGKFTRSGDMI